jgi:hypothetical protein
VPKTCGPFGRTVRGPNFFQESSCTLVNADYKRYEWDWRSKGLEPNPECKESMRSAAQSQRTTTDLRILQVKGAVYTPGWSDIRYFNLLKVASMKTLSDSHFLQDPLRTF